MFPDPQLHHADPYLLVAEKPAGLLSVPGRTPENQDCLVTRLQRAHPDALTVHRLDQVTSGSRGIVLGGVDYSAYSAQKKGEPLEVAIPTSGTTVTPRPVMILKSSDNKEAAEAFVDFMFSDEAQEISASKNMIPANKDIAPKNGPKLDEIKTLNDDLDGLVSQSKDIKETFAKRYLK